MKNRLELFNYYKNFVDPTLSIQFNIDELTDRHKKGAFFMTVLLHSINKIKNFKIRYDGTKLIEFDNINIGYTVALPNGEFNLAVSKYHENIVEQYNIILQDIETTKKSNNKFCDGALDLDMFYCSVIPFLDFKSIKNPVKGNNYDTVPIILVGKQTDKLPISITGHRGLIDAYHINLLKEEIIKTSELLNKQIYWL